MLRLIPPRARTCACVDILLVLLTLLGMIAGCGGDDCGPTSDWPHCNSPTSSGTADPHDEDDDGDDDDKEDTQSGGGSTKKDAGTGAKRDAGRTLLDAAGLTDDSGLSHQTCTPEAVDAGMPDGSAPLGTSADGGCEPDH